MSKLVLNGIVSGYASNTAYNTNNALIETALENTLSRDGTTPNQMEAHLDMNGYMILNQANPVTISGFLWRGDWTISTLYSIGDVVHSATTPGAYYCIVEHTSTNFANDLAAFKWQIVVESSFPSQIGNTNKFLQTDGSIVSWQTPTTSYINTTQTGTGAVSRTVQNKLTELVSVLDFGAVGDGVTDDTTAITNAKTAIGTAGTLLIPAGSYLYSGTVYAVNNDFEWHNDGYAAFAPMANARNNCILFTGQTENVSPIDSTKSKIPLSITIVAKGAQHASGVRSNLVNYSTDGNGCTAFYGRASSTGTSTYWSSALHGETRHAGGTSIGVNSENASYESTGTLIGLAILNSTSGAETTHPQTAAAKALCTNAYGIYILGTNDAANSDAKGAWKYGLYVSTASMRAGGISVYLAPLATVAAHIQTSTSSPASTADIFLQGDSGYGIICNGIYKNGAIRVNNDQFIGLNSAATVGIKFDTTAATNRVTLRGGITAITGTAQAGGASTITLAAGASATNNDPTYIGHVITITGGTGSGQQALISTYDGATKVATVVTAWTTVPNATSTYSIRSSTERVGFTVSATPSIYLNSTKVIGTQDTGWTAMTGTANKNTSYDTSTVTLAQLAGRVMSLQAALTTHGLLGA